MADKNNDKSSISNVFDCMEFTFDFNSIIVKLDLTDIYL